MPPETFIEKQEENIAIHIFTVSSAMVGVRKRRLLLEKISDIGFLTGLSIMAVICILIVYKFL